MSKQFILAYCVENSNIAREIERNLSQADYTFEHVVCSESGADMGEVLDTKSGKIILLISDNFLRSIACMKNGLSWFQRLGSANRLLPVVIDGRRLEEGNWKSVPTSFSKVSNVIKYMNYWQEEYLELRKNKRTEAGDDTEYNEHLKYVRTISSGVGEFLRHVRSSKHFSYNEFRRNNYEELFRWNDDMAWHKVFGVTPREPLTVDELVIVKSVKIETPSIPATDKTIAPIAEEVISTPEIGITQGISNPVELAKPEPIEVPDIETEEVEEEEVNIVEELFEENEEEVSLKSEPIISIPEIETTSVENNIALLDQLSTVEETEENSLDRLVNEIVAEEKENQADVGITLEDLDEALFGEDDDNSIVENVSIEDISTENLFSISKEEEESEVVNNSEKHKVIERILTDSRAALDDGNVPDALNMLKRGTDKYPEEVNLRYYYAYVLANSADNTKTAKEQLNSVLKQSPNHADANYLAGEIAELEEDFINAKLHYSRVVELDKEYPNAHYRLASILAKRFTGKEELAVSYFKIAAKQDKTNVDALYQTADLYERKFENYEKAIKYYHKTLKYDSENADVYIGLARIALAQEDKGAALDFYKKAVEIDSNLATHVNQRLFAPAYVIQKMEATVPVLSAKDIRLKELEADIIRLEGKLSEMEQEIDKQSNDQQKISTSIHKISGNGSTASILGVETERLSIEEKEPGKVVFITGATSGIGKATSEIFARNGYRVIITGRRLELLDELKSQYISDYQADVKILSYDVRNPIAVKEAVQSLEGDWRNVDILINNAGLAKGFSSIQEGDIRHWEQMIDTNIKGLLYMTRAVAPHMVERRGGHIINVCSTAGHEVYPNGNVYCATKHAVNALTKSMRIDLHKHNVRVSQVSPGHVEETEFALVRFDGDADRAKIYDDFRPLTARDVSETIYFMASRPTHVNIQDVLLMGTQQASSTHVDRSGR